MERSLHQATQGHYELDTDALVTIAGGCVLLFIHENLGRPRIVGKENLIYPHALRRANVGTGTTRTP